MIIGNPIPKWIKKYATEVIKSHKNRGFVIGISNERLAWFITRKLVFGCNYCGCDLKYYYGKVPQHLIKPNSISIDIINPNRRILSENNIQLLCHQCNQTKARNPHGEFVRFCNMITAKFGMQWV